MMVIIKNDSDEAFVWNSDNMSYDGIITYTDLTEMLLFIYESLKIDNNGIQYLVY